MKPLDGIRVLDFGRYIAGPGCAALLGDLGAEVIRIERRGGGEDRQVMPLIFGANGQPIDGATFLQLNRNKRSLTLDFAAGKARPIMNRLIQNADVVIANLPPAVLLSMHLDYASISEINSRCILVTPTAFGSRGPYAERTGFDGIAQVMSGAAWYSGEPDKPSRTHAQWVDFATAAYSALGVLAALRAREVTGRGQVVETSLLATALNVFNAPLMEQSVSRPNRQPQGNRAHTTAPTDLHKCVDGWIMIAVAGDTIYRRWARLMGEEIWVTDPRFATEPRRAKNSAIFSKRMDEWCAQRTVAEAIAMLSGARVPAGPIYDLDQVLGDPHVRDGGFLQEVMYPGLPRPALVAITPLSLSDTPLRTLGRAPLAGEHTDEIMAALGFSAGDIASLRADAVI